MSNKPLDDAKREEFAHAYIALRYNARAAAAACGFDPEEGSNMLCLHGVAERVRALQRPLLKRHDVTADRTMMGLARVAFVDPRRMIDPATGGLRHIDEMDPDVAGAIKGFKVREEFETDGYHPDLATGKPDKSRPILKRVVTTEIKLNDRVPALTVLAKHFKLVNDEGDGLTALASALSDRLQRARSTSKPRTVIDSTANPNGAEDARIIDRDVQAEPAHAVVPAAVQEASDG